jgi:signal transduction histidine kinase
MTSIDWPARLPARPTLGLRVAVGAGLLLLTTAALAIPSNLSPSPLETRVAGVAVGWAIAAGGIVIWERRPGNGMAPLLVLGGALWILGRLQGAAFGPLALAANLSNSLAQVVVFAALVTFPTGRMPSRFARALIAYSVVTVVGANLALATSIEVQRLTGERNPIFLPLDPTLRRVIVGILQLASYGGALVGVIWLIARWLRSSAPARRSFLPIFVAGVTIVGIVLVCQLAINAGGLTNSELYGLVTIQLLSFALLPAAIAASVLRDRMARGALADLVVELGASPAPERLREALVTALGDPTLEIVYWSEQQSSYVGPDGAPLVLPAAGSRRMVTQLEREGQALAAIIHDPALADDPGLVTSVGTAVRLAVENERLTREVRTQLAEVRASRARIVEAGDAERRRVERNLHDGAQQRLVAMSLALRRAKAQLPADAAGEAATTLDEAAEQLKSALAELRALARGIHPVILTEAGLAAALRALARDSPIPATVDVDLPDDLADPVEAAAYFVAAEALTNAAKYAGANQVRITASASDRELRVTISDDGRGGADLALGSGLRGLADRVAVLGGSLDVRSPAGGGTRIEAHVPLDLAPEAPA